MHSSHLLTVTHSSHLVTVTHSSHLVTVTHSSHLVTALYRCVFKEEIQTEAAADSDVAEEEPSLADLTAAELRQQLDDLGHELQHRNNKKHKYKQLLQVRRVL